MAVPIVSFSVLTFVFVIFWQKGNRGKSACKMLVNLTTSLFFLLQFAGSNVQILNGTTMSAAMPETAGEANVFVMITSTDSNVIFNVSFVILL